MVAVGDEVLVGQEADENDGFGIEALCLVDGGVADAVGGVLLLDAFAQVAASQNAATAERAVGDVRLRV